MGICLALTISAYIQQSHQCQRCCAPHHLWRTGSESGDRSQRVQFNSKRRECFWQWQPNALTSNQSLSVSQPRTPHSRCTDEHHTHNHAHLFGISSVEVRIPPLSAEQHKVLDKWLRCVLWENTLPCTDATVDDMEILRTKGVVSVSSGQVYILQGVRDMYELKVAPNTADRPGKLVFIGKNVNQELFTSSFRRYMCIE